MGAWSTGTFDNDTACDWVSQLVRTHDLSEIRRTLAAVSNVGEEYLEADMASEGLAACEALARLLGNWGKRTPYTQKLDEWVQMHPLDVPVGLIHQATAVIDRITESPSELLDLWSEGDDGSKWLDDVNDLRQRLQR